MTTAKTTLEHLAAMAQTTGYVTLDSMTTVLLELAYVEAVTPDIDPRTLPKADDYGFWKRCKMVDAIQ